MEQEVKDPVVYVTQDVWMRNQQTHEMERKFDISPAKKFGQVQYLLQPDAEGRNTSIMNTVPIVRLYRTLLRDFSDDDYLLLLGDPALLAIAAAIAAERNHGRFKLLKWDRPYAEPNSTRRLYRYVAVQIDIRGREV